LHPTSCHCFFWFPRDLLNNLAIIPIHILIRSPLIWFPMKLFLNIIPHQLLF
jgi:hypothetical protein